MSQSKKTKSPRVETKLTGIPVSTIPADIAKVAAEEAARYLALGMQKEFELFSKVEQEATDLATKFLKK